MLNIGSYKSVNDHSGHSTDDTVILAIRNAIKAIIRPSDYAFRFGGGFFIIIFGMADTHAQAPADDLRESVKALILFDHTAIISLITISAGIATFIDMGRTERWCKRQIRRCLWQSRRGVTRSF